MKIKTYLLIIAFAFFCTQTFSQSKTPQSSFNKVDSTAKNNTAVFKNVLEEHNQNNKRNYVIIAFLFLTGICVAIYIRYLEKSKLVRLIEKKNDDLDKLNKILTETNKQLEDLIATRDQFISIIAHDLKSPFNSIIGFAEIISEESKELTPEEISEYAYSIRESSKNTLALLQNLLDWSRAQTGKMQVDKSLFSIKDTIDENMRLHKFAAERKKIELSNRVAREVIVNADEAMISAVFRNLIGNAIKFTSEGKVEITAKQLTAFIEISVTDCGIGIAKENLEKIFSINSFYSTRGTENEHGTGLGLRLCKEFVEQNGGTIRVESDLGKGSSFIFTVPAK